MQRATNVQATTGQVELPSELSARLNPSNNPNQNNVYPACTLSHNSCRCPVGEQRYRRCVCRCVRPLTVHRGQPDEPVSIGVKCAADDAPQVKWLVVSTSMCIHIDSHCVMDANCILLATATRNAATYTLQKLIVVSCEIITLSFLCNMYTGKCTQHPTYQIIPFLNVCFKPSFYVENVRFFIFKLKKSNL